MLEQIGDHGREQAWRLIRMALRSGGNARFTFHAHHAADVRFEDPTGWHLVPRALEEEAARFGMSLSFATLARTSGTVPGRRPTGAVVSLTDSAHVLDRPTRFIPQEHTMTEHQSPTGRLTNALRRRLPGGRVRRLAVELQHERERISQLEAELDELRRDNLRVAELLDLIESRLTP